MMHRISRLALWFKCYDWLGQKKCLFISLILQENLTLCGKKLPFFFYFFLFTTHLKFFPLLLKQFSLNNKAPWAGCTKIRPVPMFISLRVLGFNNGQKTGFPCRKGGYQQSSTFRGLPSLTNITVVVSRCVVQNFVFLLRSAERSRCQKCFFSHNLGLKPS